MLKVVCGIIQNSGKVLIAQRSETMKLPLKWEFPGGKVKENEDKISALRREIKEELNLDIKVLQELQAVTHHYPDFSICLYPFLCTSNSRDVKLTEHQQVVWERLENLEEYDWAAADWPVVREVLDIKFWTKDKGLDLHQASMNKIKN